MFDILPANQKFMSWLKLAALCAATAIVGLWLSTSPVKADEMGSFNESGQYQYHSYQPGSSLRPSIGQPGYDTYHRQSELADRQAEQWRQEALRQERERAYSAPPVAANSNPYNFPEAVVLPGGRMMMCSKSFHTTYCQ